ncbi:unnamed protein product [Clonostachys rosea]|uniref:F-box domain-containing protein n=1 Tax=Bionectria ochroleuca TaxID=29856 RepID=A0ABY6U200_BIOOC|nr:unnamed protein product [Clonostachys rosea]
MAIHVPNEILSDIMRYLVPALPSERRKWRYDSSLRPSDLASLCLVSRRFRHVAQPLLYHTIDVTQSTTAEGQAPNWHWPGLLLKTIVKNPDLAKYIRVLAIPDMLFLPPTADMIFLPDTSPTGFPWDVPRCIRNALEPEIEYNSYTLPVIALLLYAPMVEKIILFSGDPGSVEVKWILTSWHPQGQRYDPAIDFGPDLTRDLGPFANYGLPCLKDLHVDLQESEHGVTPLLDFLKKPGLSIFHLSHARSFTGLLVPRPLRDSLSGVRELNLSDCYIEPLSLENILRSCPRLEALGVHVAEPSWAEELLQQSNPNIFWTINLGDFGQTLRGFGESLTDLHLDFSPYKTARPVTGRIGSLRSMSKLRHLQCDRNDLVLDQSLGEELEDNTLPLDSVLPSSITTLRIHYIAHDISLSLPGSVISADMESLLSSRRLQSLKQVQLRRYNPIFEDEIDLSQPSMLGWSFKYWKTPANVGNGFLECLYSERSG